MNLLNCSNLFKKIFNRENEGKQNMDDIFRGICENCSIEMPKFDRIVVNPIKADNRTIYPIMDVAFIGNKMQSFKGIEIFPIALVIEEAGEKYAISLTEEEIDPGEFIGMISKK